MHPFLPSFPSKTANPFVFIYLFIYLFTFIYLFIELILVKNFYISMLTFNTFNR